MILQNYWKWKNVIANTKFQYVSSSSGVSGYDITTTMVDTSGENAKIRRILTRDYTEPFGWIIDNMKLNSQIALQFDSGTEELESSIYAMPNQISNISQSTLTFAYAGEEENGKLSILFSGTNNNSEEITITRIGVIKRILSGTDSYTDRSPVSAPVLMGVIELNTPLTVPAGTGFTINAEWIEA